MAIVLPHPPEMFNKEIKHFTPELESVPLKALQNTDVEIPSAHMEETMDETIINKWDKDEDYSLPMAKLDDSKVSIKIEEIHIKSEEGSEYSTFNGIDQKESTWPVASGKMENIYVTQEENVINEALSNTPHEEDFKEYPIIQKHLDLPKNSYNFEQLYCHRDVRSKLVNGVRAQNNDFDTNVLNHEDLPNIGMLKCETSKYQIEHKCQLNSHTKPSEMKMFKCDICAYEAKRKSVLKRHMLTHKKTSEIKMFKCEVCTYEAKRISCVTAHMLIHKKPSEIKMFKCEICTYETDRKGSLNKHMLIHKKPCKIKEFKCEICTEKQKCYVKSHMLIHKKSSEIQLFKCEICAYEAKKKGGLTSHMLIHKKPSEITFFKCEICPYEAKRKSNLKEHMLIHKKTSEIETFYCDICSYEAKLKKSLRKHMLIHQKPSEIQFLKCGCEVHNVKHKNNIKDKKRKKYLKHTYVNSLKNIGVKNV